ncbi:MAG: adenylosuccinate lyase [Bdellovibrionales bacterium]|nr:adenylosuccinate lyase [Bdellovibrionales bacterium]
MIPRYSREEMSSIWSDNERYAIWLEVETVALEEMAKVGLAPVEAAKEVRAKAKIDVQKIFDREAEVHHDVIAFLDVVADSVGPSARFLHRGMTSNDLLDTTFGVQLKKSAELIDSGILALLEAIKTRAYEFKMTPCIGRSHGIHAEPTSFGLKLATWYAELSRQRKRFLAAADDIAVGKISGPVGTYASLPPAVEEAVLKALGLRAEDVATQVVNRDRHANFFAALAQIGGSIERFCVEVRHLQRTEVGEVSEPFGSGQKGSSAMPHKKNPILTENLTGLARILRANAIAALENVPLWHERDISHSSVERVIAPDSCILADFMLARMKRVVDGMVVKPDAMMRNLELTGGLVFSGTLLLALVDSGIERDTAYRMVQRPALEYAALENSEGRSGTFKERVLADEELCSKLGKEKIEECFSLDRHLAHVEMIFKRVFQ